MWYRRDIARQFRRSLRDEADVHARLMLAYPEVPQWWYALMGVVAFVLGIITIEVWDTKVSLELRQENPVIRSEVLRNTILTCLLAPYLGVPSFPTSLYSVPCACWNAASDHKSAGRIEVSPKPFRPPAPGLLMRSSCSSPAFSVITELIVGYLLPGKPVAMMIFKTFGYISGCSLQFDIYRTYGHKPFSNGTSVSIRIRFK